MTSFDSLEILERIAYSYYRAGWEDWEDKIKCLNCLLAHPLGPVDMAVLLENMVKRPPRTTTFEVVRLGDL